MDHTRTYRTDRVVAHLGAGECVPASVLCVAGRTCQNVLRHYAWDTQLGSALQELLKHQERAMRRAMDARLAKYFGRADWWESRGFRFTYENRDMMDRARGFAPASRTPAQILDRLPFGFWVSLAGSAVDYEMLLWRPALKHAFPHFHGKREVVYRDLDRLRKLRNHLAHPDERAVSGRTDLQHLHTMVYRVMTWIDPDIAAWARTVDRVPALLEARPAPCVSACIPVQRSQR